MNRLIAAPIVALLFACSSQMEPQIEPARLSAAAGHPQDATLDRQLDELVPDLLEAYSVPGAAIGVIRGGSVFLATGYGVVDSRTNTAVTAGTLFNVGSISKPVTAWGVMRLVDNGHIALDSAISSLVKTWAIPSSPHDADGVTVSSLLSHTSGLTMWAVPEFPPGAPVPSILEMLNATTDGVPDVHLAYPPGSKWEYSGGGYAVLQLLIEEVSGRRFPDYMEAEVLKPLGMTASSYVWDDAVLRRAAVPHDSAGRPTPGQRFTATSAAGLQSSVTDMLKFAEASLSLTERNPTLLSERAATLMVRASEVSPEYGLGYELWGVDDLRFVGHGGQNEGWMAQLTLSPHTGDGLVVLTNGTNGLRIISEVQCLWMLRTFGRGCSQLSPLPVAVVEADLEALVGAYRDTSGAVVELTAHDGQLFWKTDYGYEFALRSRGGNEFGWVISESYLTIDRDSNGSVVGLTRHRGDERTPFQRVSRVDAS